MSKMQELFEKVAKDETLQETFAGIMKDAEKEGEEAINNKLIAFAKAQGYEITMEEMQAFFQKLVDQRKGELGDAELDLVAGGKGVVGGLVIAASVTSVGFFCAAISIAEAFRDSGGCESWYNL